MMNWYYLGAIKSYYLCQTVYSDSRETMKALFESIFNIVKFDKAVCVDGKIAVSANDLKKIDDIFKYYIQSYTKTSRLYPVEVSIEDYPEIESYNNDFIMAVYTKNFVKQSIDDLGRSIHKKRDVFQRHVNNLKNLYSVNKIVSFDFEYNDNNLESISEIGVSVYYPKQDIKENYHFIITDKQRRSKKRLHLSRHFKFGESKHTPLFYALAFLKRHLKTADYITGHDLVNEFNILKEYPDWNKIIDTKFCDVIINDRKLYFSLTNIMRLYGFKTAFMHNAGNDAAYVMELLLNMFDEVKEKEKILINN